jgi:S1/P1 Nuclease
MTATLRRAVWRSSATIAVPSFLLIQSVPSAWAWGRLGHRVISRLAEKQLTPAAKAAIAELLEPGESLADASLWADENRRALPSTWPTSIWNDRKLPSSAKGRQNESGSRSRLRLRMHSLTGSLPVAMSQDLYSSASTPPRQASSESPATASTGS